MDARCMTDCNTAFDHHSTQSIRTAHSQGLETYAVCVPQRTQELFPQSHQLHQQVLGNAE